VLEQISDIHLGADAEKGLLIATEELEVAPSFPFFEVERLSHSSRKQSVSLSVGIDTGYQGPETSRVGKQIDPLLCPFWHFLGIRSSGEDAVRSKKVIFFAMGLWAA
jgi:hypothetical protein